jgi:hypothetical protein
MMRVDGGCHCGAITYEAEVDPERVSLCHCTDCQILTGTAFRTGVPAREDSFKLKSGKPTTYVKTAESGNKRAHGFCGTCGTPVYSTTVTDQRVFNIRVGTLSQRGELRPKKQIWCRSARDWAMNLGPIPQVDKQ